MNLAGDVFFAAKAAAHQRCYDTNRFRLDAQRRGDLVTARLRRYPAPASEAGLEVLGRLMGCARQLDMLLRSEAGVADFVEHFLNGRYEEFG